MTHRRASFTSIWAMAARNYYVGIKELTHRTASTYYFIDNE